MSNLKGNMQRIQIGIFGIVCVLLLVSLASLVVNRASDEQTALEEIQGASAAPPAETSDKPKEPLAELGVAPALKDPADKKGVAPAAPQAQVVPDLQPDPALQKPMDEER